MSDSNPNRFQASRLINRQGLVLGSFAFAVTLILTLTHLATSDRIAANKKNQHDKALSEVLGEQWSEYQISETPIVLFDKIANANRQCFIVHQNGKPIAAIISATAPDGYSGNINMLVGVSIEGIISGVRVTSHSETPGLGDAIEARKSKWIRSFDGKSLHSPLPSKWTVQKNGGEFDQFTGATITPRSVVNEVKNTLLFFQSVQNELLIHE